MTEVHSMSKFVHGDKLRGITAGPREDSLYEEDMTEVVVYDKGLKQIVVLSGIPRIQESWGDFCLHVFQS